MSEINITHTHLNFRNRFERSARIPDDDQTAQTAQTNLLLHSRSRSRSAAGMAGEASAARLAH